MSKHLRACGACGACGEEGTSLARYNGRPLCKECYEELAFGIVKNSNVNFFGGYASPESPGQENAIRHMEDRL
jgi:hypothetical protein